MAEDGTLLAHLIPKLSGVSVENAAVECLGYILGSAEAREALASIISDCGFEVGVIAKVITQVTDGGARPDLVCFDGNRAKRIIIEAKFGAALTENQPNEYLNQLAPDGLSVLLCVAPDRRTEYLWEQLSSRVQEVDSLGPTSRVGRRRYATVGSEVDRSRHLVLVSWADLLGRISGAVGESGVQADNIRQLRGLAERMDREAFLPFREEDFSPGLGRRMIHYRDILDEVWKRCTDIGWVVSSVV